MLVPTLPIMQLNSVLFIRFSLPGKRPWLSNATSTVVSKLKPRQLLLLSRVDVIFLMKLHIYYEASYFMKSSPKKFKSSNEILNFNKVICWIKWAAFTWSQTDSRRKTASGRHGENQIVWQNGRTVKQSTHDYVAKEWNKIYLFRLFYVISLVEIVQIVRVFLCVLWRTAKT